MAYSRLNLLPDELAELSQAKLAFAITHAPHGSRAPLSAYAEFFATRPTGSAEPKEPQTPQQMERAFRKMNAVRRTESGSDE